MSECKHSHIFHWNYRSSNVLYTCVSYMAKLQCFVYKLCIKLCNVSYTFKVCVPCVLNVSKCIILV